MNRKIMIVDDEISMRMLVRYILQRHNFTLLEAEDGFAALRMLEEGPPPDLFIVDYMMPRMNGIELARQIRSRPECANSPVVLFSALKNLDLPASESVIDECLSKVTPPGLLISTINRLIKVDVGTA